MRSTLTKARPVQIETTRVSRCCALAGGGMVITSTSCSARQPFSSTGVGVCFMTDHHRLLAEPQHIAPSKVACSVGRPPGGYRVIRCWEQTC